MRFQHFESLLPICPRCARSGNGSARLDLSTISNADELTVWEGVLSCSDQDCRLEYPIIDGIPILVEDVRNYISTNQSAILRRADLSSALNGIVGDCCGPASPFDTERQQLSTYCWNHYSEFDPLEQQPSTGEGRAGALLDRVLSGGLLETKSPSIDVGCSVGRTAFQLAERTGGLVLGADTNFAMLRVAQRILMRQEVHYDRRRVGLSYERRSFPVRFNNMDLVDFWVCDGMALPFESSAFGLASSMNLLDSLASPVNHLCSLIESLADSGLLLLSCPFDWTESVTPADGWIGGHSDRAEDRGDPVARLDGLIKRLDESNPACTIEKLLHHSDAPWELRLHDRSVVHYACELLALRINKSEHQD